MNTFILLDFDGVLRPLPPRPAQQSPAQLAARFHAPELLRADAGLLGLYAGIDPQAMTLLATLCAAFDARIVLTSSWSMLYPLRMLRPMFRPWQIEHRVIGKVPAAATRPAQILAWQQAHLQDSWIALDDLAMTTEFPAHAVTIRGVFDEAAWARASELLARQR